MLFPLPCSQGLGYYLDDPARAHEEWLASRAATATAPGGAIGPAGRGGAAGNDDRLPRKSRLEVIAERQRQRNEGRGRGGGKAKGEDEELDPMDPVSGTALIREPFKQAVHAFTGRWTR